MTLMKRVLVCFVINYLGVLLAEDSTTSASNVTEDSTTTAVPSLASNVSTTNASEPATNISEAATNVSENATNVSNNATNVSNNATNVADNATTTPSSAKSVHVSVTTSKIKKKIVNKGKPVLRSSKKSQYIRSRKQKKADKKGNHHILRSEKLAQFYSPQPKADLRYGFQSTGDCKDFEKAFLCVRKCLDHGFDVSYSDRKCRCTCYKNRDKAQYTRPRKHNTTKWKLGTPSTNKPYWAQPKTEEPEKLTFDSKESPIDAEEGRIVETANDANATTAIPSPEAAAAEEPAAEGGDGTETPDPNEETTTPDPDGEPTGEPNGEPNGEPTGDDPNGEPAPNPNEE